jgi:hypothetical protein
VSRLILLDLRYNNEIGINGISTGAYIILDSQTGRDVTGVGDYAVVAVLLTNTT